MARPDAHGVVEHQQSHGFIEHVGPPAVVVGSQGQFVGGARQLVGEHVRVGGIDDGGFGWSGKDLVGVVHVPLVELVVAGHEHGHRRLGAAPSPPCLLPHGGGGAGKPVEHHGVEPAHVDAQLQGGGGDHGSQVPGEHGLLHGPAFSGQQATAIGLDAVGQPGGESPAHLGGQYLGASPAPAKRKGAVALAYQQPGEHGAVT